MSKRKRRHPELKAKLGLESMKSGESAGELASRFGMLPTMTYQWNRAQH
jgi:transposase